jgi:hypothetical protein
MSHITLSTKVAIGPVNMTELSRAIETAAASLGDQLVSQGADPTTIVPWTTVVGADVLLNVKGFVFARGE